LKVSAPALTFVIYAQDVDYLHFEEIPVIFNIVSLNNWLNPCVRRSNIGFCPVSSLNRPIPLKIRIPVGTGARYGIFAQINF
jgi:hypothetical protein